MARVVVVGSGTVGEATGRGFLRLGHAVNFVDISPTRVEELRSKGLAASTEIDLAGPPAFVFIAVPTPNDGRRYDLRHVEAAVRSVGKALRDSSSFHTVVTRSTLPPGTTEGLVVRRLEEEAGKTVDEDFGLASNPEFLRASSNFEDFITPWVTIIGSRSPRTRERLADLYRPFGGTIRLFNSPTKAEFAKVAHNLFNATKISFWNEMWQVAARLGVSSDEIASVVAYSAEGSINPEYGIRGGLPFGGACLPKDGYGFIGFAEDIQIDIPLIEAVMRVNEAMDELLNAELEGLSAARSVGDGHGAKAESVIDLTAG